MAVTIYDIAREAGISHSAVSMALRGTGRVSANTRDRIHKIADRLGYRVNASASNLRSLETKIISAVMPLQNNSCKQVIMAMQKECEHRGYQVLWQNLSDDREDQRRVFAHLCSGYSDAALIQLFRFADVAEYLERYTRSGRPVVLFGSPIDFVPMPGVQVVDCDNSDALRSVISLLIAQGHRDIVHIQPAVPAPGNEIAHRTITDAMAAHGLPTDGVGFRFAQSGDQEGDHYFDGYRCAEQLCEKRPGMTAVHGPNDVFMIGLMRRLMERGIRVPEDVSLVGSDNVADGKYSAVRLTTIDLKFRQMAMTGCRMLCDQLTQRTWPERPERIVMHAEVVLRDSVASAPVRARGVWAGAEEQA